jgi:hypothetical protein
MCCVDRRLGGILLGEGGGGGVGSASTSDCFWEARSAGADDLAEVDSRWGTIHEGDGCHGRLAASMAQIPQMFCNGRSSSLGTWPACLHLLSRGLDSRLSGSLLCIA